jgi:hypothetical protein
MRALSSLNLATNGFYAEGTKLLAEVLKGNNIMTELNISDNGATWDGNKHGEMSGIVALADAIPDMGALSSLNLASNWLCGLTKFGDGTFDASGIHLLSLSHLAHTCLVAQVLPPLPMPSPIWGL